MKKFMGDGGHTPCDSKSIKLEPAFLAENEEVMYDEEATADIVEVAGSTVEEEEEV